jgi:hypothetical protein
MYCTPFPVATGINQSRQPCSFIQGKATPDAITFSFFTGCTSAFTTRKGKTEYNIERHMRLCGVGINRLSQATLLCNTRVEKNNICFHLNSVCENLIDIPSTVLPSDTYNAQDAKSRRF